MTKPPENTLARALNEQTIQQLLENHLTRRELSPCRLVCRDLAAHLAPLLFADITVVFRSRTLTRPSRRSALERVGHHIRTVTFKFPHFVERLLPPVIVSINGTEQTFVYMPQRQGRSPDNSRYGSMEIITLLVKRYPPLFHAATDTLSFERALTLMTNLRHLRVNCSGQPSNHRYRRNVVNYALISLRMAVEQSPLGCLENLSLVSIHPAAVFYLQPNLGFGASPVSHKRWSQIRHLTIHMESFPYEAGGPTDHFKLLHAYLQSFPGLKSLVVQWKGERGLSPLSLATEPCLQSSPRIALTRCGRLEMRTSLRPLKVPSLQQVELVSAKTDASQIASFIKDPSAFTSRP